ncbi:hypothetical protein [Nocardioides sp. AE5]|uniref:hypothetical protein n=1 Tax=Nocardioides sp. AE5 TaxID=2962573 RepID=UPI002882ADE5|nr:hypothetical protein [Nocardioides sp. AE5]MDT0200774.1 hypothetical protein [Nocardioides sp. AE5]
MLPQFEGIKLPKFEDYEGPRIDVGERFAFPLVSAGVYGWPREDAAAAAIETLRATPTQVTAARMVAFNRSAYELIAQALRS